MPSLVQRVAAEAVGTAFLLMAVVGSGIMAQRLSPGDVGLQLFENAVATAFALMALIWAFGPISGAHFNPAVTLADVALQGRPVREGIAYVGAQVAGGIGGTILANLMFDLPPVAWSTKDRNGPDLWLAETIATIGLLMVIFLIPQRRGVVIAGGGRGIYRSGVLLHVIHQFRQPGGDGGADVFGHVRGDCAGLRAAVHRDAVGGGGIGDWVGMVPGGTAAIAT